MAGWSCSSAFRMTWSRKRWRKSLRWPRPEQTREVYYDEKRTRSAAAPQDGRRRSHDSGSCGDGGRGPPSPGSEVRPAERGGPAAETRPPSRNWRRRNSRPTNRVWPTRKRSSTRPCGCARPGRLPDLTSPPSCSSWRSCTTRACSTMPSSQRPSRSCWLAEKRKVVRVPKARRHIRRSRQTE